MGGTIDWDRIQTDYVWLWWTDAKETSTHPDPTANFGRTTDAIILLVKAAIESRPQDIVLYGMPTPCVAFMFVRIIQEPPNQKPTLWMAGSADLERQTEPTGALDLYIDGTGSSEIMKRITNQELVPEETFQMLSQLSNPKTVVKYG